MTEYSPETLHRLEPLYLPKYQLHSAPFSAVHEDRFLYLDNARAERLNLLTHMTQFSNLLLILMGESGVGKTSLLQRFLNTAQPDWRICQFTANTMMDAEQLLFAAAQGFGLQQLPHDATQLQEMLYSRLATLHRQEHIPILIIDEAHSLPKDALLAVFHLADAQVDQGNLIRIILGCEPLIEKILQSKEIRVLRERVTHTMELTAFDENTTAEYLKHRMAVAGFTGVTPFTPKLVKKIYKASEGNPARINTQAHQLLTQGEVTPLEQTEPEIILSTTKRNYKSMLLITLAAGLAVVGFMFQKQINSLFNEPGAKIPAPTVTTATPAPVPIIKEKTITLNSTEGALTLSIPVVSVTPAATTPATGTTTLQTNTTPAVAITPPAASITVENPTPTAVTGLIDIRSLEPANLSPSSKPQTLTINGQDFTQDSQVVVGWGGHEKTLGKNQVKFINSNELQITITTGMKADAWSVQVLDPLRGKTARKSFAVGKPAARLNNRTTPPLPVVSYPTAKSVTGIQDESWIRAQSPQHFTLQLFGTSTRDNAAQFIKHHHLTKEVAIFKTRNKGKPWYSVISGAYPSEAAAHQASTRLPVALQQAKPWIRRFDSVQASLAAAPTQPSMATTTPVRKPLGPTPTSVARNNSTALTQNEAYLWSQDPRHFTLQLFVTQQVEHAQKLITSHPVLSTKAVYFRSRHSNQDTFTVVFGDYTTHDQAQAAIAQLPTELRVLRPEVRTMASVHAEMQDDTLSH
ncbi:MAG: SPOR domain-containing protein [Gammaproteobacteria bacterium]|nr:SPOR domain-containing protein [Gammaproteobacteria bacterium]